MDRVATAAVGSLSSAEPARLRRRSGLSVTGWAVGTVVVGGMVIWVLLPSLCKSSETANRAKCASNLHQIGLAILLYAQDNGGRYPPSLAVLPGQEQVGSEVMVCPSSNDERSSAADTAGVVADLATAETDAAGHKHCLSYVYAGRGLTVATASATAVVAYEPLGNHDGDGTNVLFGDRHAEWVKKRAWPKVAAAAGVAVVPPLADRR